MFDKDDQDISQIIETSLDAVVSGRATLDEIVAQHPEHADVLRSELEVALWLVSRKEQVAPRPNYVSASRKRVISRIKDEAKNKGAKRSIFGFLWPQKVAYQWVAALLALIILFSGTGGLVTVSQSALPGEGLYAVKQVSETVALAVTANEVRKVEMSAAFVERRVNEVTTLIERGNMAQAVETLQSFENQVGQTVLMLQDVEQASAHEKKELAVTVQKQLNEQAGKLEKLQENAPADLRAELAEAGMLSTRNATLAGEEAERIVDPTQTPTVVPPTTTSTPVPSQSPEPPNDTPMPVPTVAPTEGSGEGLGEPSLVPDPTNPNRLVTKTPNPNKPATNTPRPTNENRPTKQPDPDDKPEEKPPKPEKPDKGQGKGNDK